jgi:hypothetical protein
MTPKNGEETMPTQNPTSSTKPPEGRNDGSDKENSERRVKLGSETTSGGMGTPPRVEDRKPDQKTDLQEAGSISELLKKWRVELVRVCRENPLTALGVAFMAGRMLRRRRRPAKSK